MQLSNFWSKLSHHQKIGLLFFLITIPYVLGLTNPDSWWGTHFIFFLPTVWGMGLCLGIAIISIFSFKRESKAIKLGEYLSRMGNFSNPVLLTLGLFYAVAFYLFPITADYYGNARSFIPLLNQEITELPSGFLSEIFQFKLEPGNGRHGVMQFYGLISHLFGLNLHQIFLIMGSLFGGAFVALWLYMIQQFIKHKGWRVCLALCGLTGPFLLIFFGHIDTYAPLYFLLLLWWFLYIQQVRSKRTGLLWVLLILLLVGIRFHTLSYLMAPALGLLFLERYGKMSLIKRKLANLRGLLLFIYLPCCLLGVIVYFFILQDYNDPRTLDDFTNMERLFLPMISPEPPLDAYNLFSWNHFFDFINIAYFWSSISLFLLIVLFFSRRINLKKSSLEINAILLTILLVVSFLFMFNPLLSMPMDWDLFVFPAPLLLIFLLLGFENAKESQKDNVFIIPAMILGLMSLPAFFVTGSIDSHSKRMESVGVHVYHSYYAHSSDYMLYALQMIPDNPGLYMERKEILISKLRPDAKVGIDPKFASLLVDDGFYKLKYMGRTVEAKRDFEAALRYDPNSKKSWLHLMEANFSLQDFAGAFSNAEKLVALSHPDRPTAIGIAIHCALEAQLYNKALLYSKVYLKDYPQNPFIQKIKNRLENNDRVDELKSLFQTKE